MRRPSHLTLKACLNLHIVSFAATLVFVVMRGQNESDDSGSHEFYHVPSA